LRLAPKRGRELNRSDFCYEDRALFIRKNKSHRERLIPIADDVAEMCRDYMNKSIKAYPDTRNCGAATRNQRISAIKSFLKYAAGKDTVLIGIIGWNEKEWFWR